MFCFGVLIDITDHKSILSTKVATLVKEFVKIQHSIDVNSVNCKITRMHCEAQGRRSGRICSRKEHAEVEALRGRCIAACADQMLSLQELKEMCKRKQARCWPTDDR